MKTFAAFAISALVVLGRTDIAFAGDCDCTITMASSDTHLLAADVGPGDVVCLEPGTRGELWVDGVEGDENDPVIIRNCGGATTFTKRINLVGSRYIRLSGAGDPATYYGIVIGTDQAQAVSIYGFSSDIEVEFVEITASGFAGVMGKTDNADLSFVQYNTLIHDNYIHDVDGEGIYLGNSFYDEDTSHSLVGTRVYRNVIVDTGWDGLQVGAADEDTEIFDNYVQNTGILTDDFQQRNGIQIGRGTTGKVYGNVIVGAAAHGIIDIGIGDVVVANNVIVSPGADGVWFSPRAYVRTGEHPLGVVANNTILEPGESGLQLHNETATTDNHFQNNLVVRASGRGYVELDPETPLAHEANAYAATATEAGLVVAFDASTLEGIEPRLRRAAVIDAIAIAEAGQAVDTGLDVSEYGITTDARGIARPYGAAYDIGAFELSPEGEGGSGGAGSTSSAGGSATTATGSGSAGGAPPGGGDPVEDAEPVGDDGCGCRTQTASSAFPSAVLAMLMLAGLRSRRRR
jgi:MYXO-CTERM domain-containing protein